MDPEIEAMTVISEAMGRLEPGAARRVLKWAFDKFSPKGELPVLGGGVATGISPLMSGAFHEVFDAANPSSGPEKALVAGYWFQVVRGEVELDSQALNKELKNLGHPSTNITRDLDALINRTPRLVMQVRKEGGTRQARRRYKLTVEGIRAVERMVGSRPQSEEVGAE